MRQLLTPPRRFVTVVAGDGDARALHVYGAVGFEPLGALVEMALEPR